MTTTLTYRINAPHIVHELFEDGEAAIINLKSGAYYSLDPVGACIWSLIDQRCSQGDIVERLMQRYDGSLVQMINDVNALMAGLQAEELIVPETGDPASSPSGAQGAAAQGSLEPGAAPPAKAPYSAPVFERFEDMKELLLLDPIHDVGDPGWPHAKTDKS
ncbi:MAG: PqqD family protein [Vicinamibacterales bacterium]